MNNEWKWLIGIVGGTLVICMCVGVICLAAGGIAAFQIARSSNDGIPSGNFPPQVTEEVVPLKPTPLAKTKIPGATPAFPEVTPTAWETGSPDPQDLSEAQQTLNTLENQVIPNNDPRELAERLEGKKNIPETVGGTPPAYKVGDGLTFWASNTDTNEHFQVKAKLAYITPHLYFWVEDGIQYDQNALKRLCETFEDKIYPTNRNFFGSEWSPGIDNDPHLYLLYARNVGSTVAGYFSSADSVNPEAFEYSNAHEMFVVNADSVTLEEQYFYSTVAHEFQHMIHWHLDQNEESWVNEGFSELAVFLNGYETGGMDYLFATSPDVQLTYWPAQPDSTPNYGASFLFWTYFLDRFGDEATQAVVADPDNGMDSIDTVLKKLNQTDPQTGKAVLADDVYADWVLANYLHDPRVGDGRFDYKGYSTAPRVEGTHEEDSCSSNWRTGSVHQYGVNYVQIQCSGSYNLQFEGASEVGVLPADAYSGDYAFWSNRADDSDMTLTRSFDFSGVSGPLTMSFRAWWDLEEDYDYLYLEASEDGSTWQILKTPSGRDKSRDPSGNAYGWGYNGQTGDWIEEQVDLSQFAGKKVQLRFEYVTDGAVNENGFLLDDVKIPAVQYSEDFEKGDGGWEAKGFVRIVNRLPQQFRVSLIRDGRTTAVEYITLGAGQTASIPLQFGPDMRNAVLVVSGVTRFTTQQASYRFRFEK